MAKKVLVVDDEKLIVKGIRFSLEQDGMEVDYAYDGESALEAAHEKKYDIILLEKKDYIKNPKPSGYRSLHLIIQTPIFLQEGKRMVTVEVQLRTIAMDFWASLEHKLKYKKNIISEEQSVFLAEEMSQCAEISASLDERMQKVKDMLIQSEQESKEPEKPTRLLNLINR